MNTHIEAIKAALTRAYHAYEAHAQASSFRDDIKADTAGTINGLPNTPENAELLELKKYLGVAANNAGVREDALRVANRALLSTAKDVGIAVNGIIDALNAYIKSNHDIYSDLMLMRDKEAMVDWAKVANSSLAHNELYEKKVHRALSSVMANASGVSATPNDWLVGVQEELALINMADLVSDYDYGNIPRMLENGRLYISDTNVDRLGAGSVHHDGPYGALVNYSGSTEVPLSTVQVVTGLFRTLLKTPEHVAYPNPDTEIDHIDFDKSYEELVSALENDALCDTSTISKYSDADKITTRLYACSRYVIARESIAYDNLTIFKQAMSLGVELTR